MGALVVSLSVGVLTTRGNEPARSDIVASTLLPSPSPSPAQASPLPTPSPVASPTEQPDPYVALRGRLERLLSDPELAVPDGSVSIAIRDAQGRVVLDRGAHRPVLPASTQKLVVAAAALQAWGADHRFVTKVLGTGPLLRDGTLDGDLVLVGGGDPVLGTAGYGRYVYPVRPRTSLEELAMRIRTAGVRRIAGHVVADTGRFAGSSYATGWKTTYWHDFDARHITGLTVDGGLSVQLRIPVDEEEAALLSTGAPPDGGAPGAGDAEPEPPDVLFEALPDDLDPDVELELSPRPPAEAARQLRRLLEARDIAARPEIGEARTLPEGTLLASVASPPLGRVLQHTVQRSDNQIADTLFRELGVELQRDGTWEGGALGVRRALGTLGLPWSGVVLADGSGLSRNDRLTAAFLAELDAAMAASPAGEVWSSLMAVSGRQGTLRHRLRGTPGEGRLLGKTGTLDDVAAVAGTVTGPGDSRFHLAVVGNDVTGGEREIVRRIVDELTLALVEELDGLDG